MNTKLYQGFLREGGWGEADDILYLISGDETEDVEPLAVILQDDLDDKTVSVRYYICDKRCTLEEAKESFIKQLSGQVDTDVRAHYSEITGYLWTDEKINIGGHDLIEELHSHKDKWLILLIDIHNLAP
jgi:hypothetical protein